MYPLLSEALRIASFGIGILPIPHGHNEPCFDWKQYTRRWPSSREIDAWLSSRVGIGAIGGKVSGNLVALQFTSGIAYSEWKRKHSALAERLPAFTGHLGDWILFRTPEPTPSSVLFVEGFVQKAGKIWGEDSVFPIPPSLAASGEPLKWIVPMKEAPEVLSLDEAGAIPRTGLEQLPPRQHRPLGQVPSLKERLSALHDGGTELDDGMRYGHLFQPASEYRQDPNYRDREWIVENFLPESYVAILAGATKSGKSCLATSLAMAVAAGEPFLDMRTLKAPVLWIAYEESHEERSIALDAYSTLEPNLFICHEKLAIDTREGLEAIQWWVRNVRAKLIVIDSLYAAVDAPSLSDGRYAREALAGLKEVCRVERCAALVLHHMVKDSSFGTSRERIAESTQILATASMDVMMDTTTKSDGSREIWLRSHGRGDFANRVWVLSSNGIANYEIVACGAERDLVAGRGHAAVLNPLRKAASPMLVGDVALAANLSVKTVQNRLRELEQAGHVRVAGMVGNSKLYAVCGSGSGDLPQRRGDTDFAGRGPTVNASTPQRPNA